MYSKQFKSFSLYDESEITIKRRHYEYKIIRKQNKKEVAETIGKYTFWVYTKDSKNRTIARDYINSDIDLEKEKIVSLIKKTPYLIDKLYDNENLFIYKKNNHNRVVVGLRKAFLQTIIWKNYNKA